jgi:hypothetical protein
MAFGIITFSMTINKMQLQHDGTQHNGRALLCRVSFMLRITNKSFMLSVIMLSDVVPMCQLTNFFANTLGK